MKVLLYAGNLKTVRKSGVGRAVLHQAQALRTAGIPYTFDEKEDYDVVHINTVFPDACRMADRATGQGKKVIYYGHSTEEDFKNSFRGSNALAPAFKQWLKFCYRKGDAVITPTPYSKRILDGYGLGRPVYAVSNGIDLDGYVRSEAGRKRFRKKFGIGSDEKIVMGVGHYMKRKGILDFAELAGRMPQYRFLWFGYTDPKLMPNEIKAVVRTILPNLSFPGYLEEGELKDAYSGSDLLFFPTYEETEGIVLLEAMAMRIPVLLRDIPIYEPLEDGRIVYKGRKTEEFERLAAMILEGKAPDLTEAAYGRVSENSIGKVAGKLEAVYRGLAIYGG